MKIMDGIDAFYTKNSRKSQKNSNLVVMICVYYILVSIELFICKILLDTPSGVIKVGLKIFELVVIYKVYLDQMRRIETREIWDKRKINISELILMLSLLLSKDLISLTIMRIIGTIKGIQNLVIPGTIEYIGTSPDTVIKVVLIGPIIEELVFRGAGLSLFKKEDNKSEAIIFTSIIFGLMHGNLGQAINATIGGFILGYMAIEFGIVYSIIFHIFNNGMLYLGYFLNISKQIETVSALILLLWIWNRKEIAEKVRNNLKSENEFSVKRLQLYFANITLVLFCILWIWEIVKSVLILT